MQVYIVIIIIIAITVALLSSIIYILSKNKKNNLYYFNTKENKCVPSPKSDVCNSVKCFKTIEECTISNPDIIHFSCTGKECKPATCNLNSSNCFFDAKCGELNCLPATVNKWNFDEELDKCASTELCSDAGNCFDSEKKCNASLMYYCAPNGCKKHFCSDPSKCFSDENCGGSGCQSPTKYNKWYYNPSKNTCNSIETCPPKVQCFSDQKKCLDEIKYKCLNKKCSRGIFSSSDCSSTNCFSNEAICGNICRGEQDKTKYYIYDAPSQKCISTLNGCPLDGSECFYTRRECRNVHSGGGSEGVKEYSWDTRTGQCLENLDCEYSSDRTFCGKSPKCEGLTLLQLQDKENLFNPSSKTDWEIESDPNGENAFNFNKFPIFAEDHPHNISVTDDPQDSESNKVFKVRYGPCSSTEKCDGDKRYGSQFWSQPLVENVDEVILEYEILFPSGFDHVLGGKLPGIFGINGTQTDFKNNKKCTHCTGSSPSNGINCWSARPMWRGGLFGEILAVIPVKGTKNCGIDSSRSESSTNDGFLMNFGDTPTKCSPSWGCDLARGGYTWPVGKWAKVSIYSKLNTPTVSGTSVDTSVSNHDGIFQLKIDGKVVSLFTNMLYRYSNELHISGLLFSTFFGGGSVATYAPKTEQQIYFKNFSLKW